MNIFGHAWVATRAEASPAFVLGAMLPDIEQMVGGRLGEVDDDAIRRGIDCHHHTDAVFHDSEPFVRLSTEGRRWLGEAGLRRGPTLAAAHVGVELLIDGFIDHGPAHDMFGAALRIPVTMRWRDPQHEQRFEWVRARLAEADIPRAYRADDEVARRLARMFSRRPRLRLEGSETGVLERWITNVRPAVQNAMPRLEQALFP